MQKDSQVKRTSLKTSNELDNNTKNKKGRKSVNIHWENEVIERDNKIKKSKTTEKKAKDLETKFLRDNPDPEDIYLEKLVKVNKIVPTKEVLEEIEEMFYLKIGKEKIPRIQPKTPRKKSVEDELMVPKELRLKFKEEDIEADRLEETMKNTLINKMVGKF